MSTTVIGALWKYFSDEHSDDRWIIRRVHFLRILSTVSSDASEGSPSDNPVITKNTTLDNPMSEVDF